MSEYSDNLITAIRAKEIKDSRDRPTLKVTVCGNGLEASFSVPSGASTGSLEALELRDADGAGVQDAIAKVSEIIAPALVGRDVLNQAEIDKIILGIDSTPQKTKLGGNVTIGVSVACAKLAAKISKQETFEYLRTLAEIKPSRQTPYLFMNLINGGKHADNNLAFQEYHVVPDVENITDAIEIGIKIDNTLKEIIKKELGADSVTLGDEGGFAPRINKVREPLEFLKKAIKESELEGKVKLALDVAASSFYQSGGYQVDGGDISATELLKLYSSLITEFDLFSIEDPFEEKDFESFSKLKNEHKRIFIIGDDLTVTNPQVLAEAIESDSINAMIIKPNQIGTLSETLETMKLARENDIELIVSHRSGETMDDFVADLAFAFNCFGLKAGAPTRPERMVKYNRLEQISNSLLEENK